MSDLKTYGLLGVGHVGTAILTALLNANPSLTIVILTRSSSQSLSSKSKSILESLPSSILSDVKDKIKFESVDYTDSSSVAQALKKHSVEVVIDTVHVYKGDYHIVLADAAKEAGVKLFFPPEYGFVTVDNEIGGPWTEKWAVQKHCKKIGLDTVVIQNGSFMQFIPWMAGVTKQDRKFHIVGKGDKPISTTSLLDVAGFIAHICTTQPSSALKNAVFRIQGDRATLQEMAARLKLTPTFVDAVPASDGIPGQKNLQTTLQEMFETGRASVGWDFKEDKEREEWVASGNKFWEGHKWTKIEEVNEFPDVEFHG
jgi:hypothetical protein